MKLPRFKLDGRGVVLRYLNLRTGRYTVLHMRGSIASGQWLQAIVSGDAYDRAEVKLAGHDHPWHRIEATRQEAREHLLKDPLLRGRVRDLDRRREALAVKAPRYMTCTRVRNLLGS